MPCRYDDFGESERTAAENNKKRDDELNRVTRLLCMASRKLDMIKVTDSETEEIKAWYKDHEAKDAIRVENEKRAAKERAKQIAASMERKVKAVKAKLKKMEAELDALKIK